MHHDFTYFKKKLEIGSGRQVINVKKLGRYEQPSKFHEISEMGSE